MGKLQRDVPLKNYSNFKIGGAASYFLEVSSVEELISGLKEWKNERLLFSNSQEHWNKIFILGSGTNILFSDIGFDWFVIHNKIEGLEETNSVILSETKNLSVGSAQQLDPSALPQDDSPHYLIVGSGVAVSDIVDYCLKNSLQGIEWAGGLPGTIGGGVRGNAGAFGGEIKDSVYSVESIDLESLEIKKRNADACHFDYRMSIFKMEDGTDEMITKVTLRLAQGKKEEIEAVAEKNIAYRNTRHPLEYPNIGSIFKNIPFEKVPQRWQEEFTPLIKNDPFPVVPVAKLFVKLNLKGKRIGDAQISEKHPNFIVNLGNATAKDVLTLIDFVKQTVLSAYGIALGEEIMYVE